VGFYYSEPFDIPNLIDFIEKAEADRVKLKHYPRDYSYCELEIEGLPFSLIVTPDRLRLEFQKPGPPSSLIEGLKEASQVLLQGLNVFLLDARSISSKPITVPSTQKWPEHVTNSRHRPGGLRTGEFYRM
jgi:hypothetical protein